MSAIRAVIHNGRIETAEPIELPEGTEFLIPLPVAARASDRDDDWDNSPEGIAAWLAWYDSLQPLVFSDEELAALEADRAARKEHGSKSSAGRSIAQRRKPTVVWPLTCDGAAEPCKSLT